MPPTADPGGVEGIEELYYIRTTIILQYWLLLEASDEARKWRLASWRGSLVRQLVDEARVEEFDTTSGVATVKVVTTSVVTLATVIAIDMAMVAAPL